MEDNSSEVVVAKDTKEEVKEKCLQYLAKCISNMEELQNTRATILKAYQREKYGNEVQGRSQVIMSDVYDTVESIMPSLMRIFYGGQDVVNIMPMGAEDEVKAKLMEAKVNYDFQRKNNGFQVLHDFFKDALLFKGGYVKWYWREEKTKEAINYEGLSEMEFGLLKETPGIEIDTVEVTTIPPSPREEGGIPISLFDVKAYKIIETSGPVVENLRQDEFLFLPDTRSVKDADFLCHRKTIKKQEAVKYGMKLEDIDYSEPADSSVDPVYMELFNDLGGVNFISPNPDSDDIFLYECYLNEYDKKGNKTPKIVTIIGNKVVQYADNPYGRPPFAVASPVRQSHRMIGTSIAELVLDIQKLRTALMRYTMDNIYYQNNGVTIVNPYRINTQMLQTNNVPGGMVFTTGDWSPADWTYPVPIKPLPPWIMNMMEMVDTVKENRTGVTRYNQGLDSKSLNRTASGISQIMSAAQQRMELVARVFAEAEDGVKAIFQALVDMNIKFFDRETSVKLDAKWETIEPQDIDGKFDIIIDIGGGTGTKEMKVNQLMQMLDKYGMMMQAVPMVITPQNIYNVVASIWENMGYKNSTMFVTDPGVMPQGMPGMPPGMMPPGMPPQGMPGMPGPGQMNQMPPQEDMGEMPIMPPMGPPMPSMM